MSVGDVDGDGKDEIVYGACAIDDDGTGLYTTGLGHGDAMHLSDMDPNQPGLEVFKSNGDGPNLHGLDLHDANTGQLLWSVESTESDGVARALALDMDPRYRGAECFGVGGGVSGVYNCTGIKISNNTPWPCFAVWWDGDLLRELCDPREDPLIQFMRWRGNLFRGSICKNEPGQPQ